MCLALESSESLRIFGHVVGQELDCHEAPQFKVFCLVHNTHPAAAESFDNSIVRDGLADHWRESYVGEMGKSMKALELSFLQAFMVDDKSR
jgi:hypothetical protein